METNLLALLSEVKPIDSFENFLQIILLQEQKIQDSYSLIFDKVCVIYSFKNTKFKKC
jgi:hypothetical protein